MESQQSQQRFKFGPHELRGLIAGFTVTQVAIALFGIAFPLGIVILSGGKAQILLLVVPPTAGIIGFLPLGGRTPAQWAGVLGGYVGRRVTGRTRWVSPAHKLPPDMTVKPARVIDTPPQLQPPSLRGL